MNKKLFVSSLVVWLLWVVLGFISFLLVSRFFYSSQTIASVSLVLNSFCNMLVIALTSRLYLKKIYPHSTKNDFLAVGILWFTGFTVLKLFFGLMFYGQAVPFFIQELNFFRGRIDGLTPILAGVLPYFWYRHFLKKDIAAASRQEAIPFASLIFFLLLPFYLFYLLQVLFFSGRSPAAWHYAILPSWQIGLLTASTVCLPLLLSERTREMFRGVFKQSKSFIRRATSVVFFYLGICLLFFVFSWVHRYSATLQLQEVFEAFVMNPKPAAVTLVGGRWELGHSGFFEVRFKADPEIMAGIIKDFKPAVAIEHSVGPFRRLPNAQYLYRKFEYEKNQYETHYLTYQPQSGLAIFYVTGAHRHERE